jgi:pseudaminic acid biosynthesis-associated methylase
VSSTIDFWSQEFGNQYTARNQPNWRERVPLLTNIIEQTGATTFLDVGTNMGWNLHALRQINADFMMSGIDVNQKALEAAQIAGFDVHVGSADQLGEIFGEGVADLVITSGVLIHIAPEDLKKAMTAIRDASKQYVLAIEYASDEEQEIDYRGNKGKLWKRPFGKLYEELGLSLVETGAAQGYDQCHYWLMEKT